MLWEWTYVPMTRDIIVVVCWWVDGRAEYSEVDRLENVEKAIGLYTTELVQVMCI